jgi:hypothetical protein
MICRLLVRHYGQLIAYGVGWTDPEQQPPVGDTGTTNPPTPTRTTKRTREHRANELPHPVRAGRRRPAGVSDIAPVTTVDLAGRHTALTS